MVNDGCCNHVLIASHTFPIDQKSMGRKKQLMRLEKITVGWKSCVPKHYVSFLSSISESCVMLIDNVTSYIVVFFVYVC